MEQRKGSLPCSMFLLSLFVPDSIHQTAYMHVHPWPSTHNTLKVENAYTLVKHNTGNTPCILYATAVTPLCCELESIRRVPNELPFRCRGCGEIGTDVEMAHLHARSIAFATLDLHFPSRNRLLPNGFEYVVVWKSLDRKREKLFGFGTTWLGQSRPLLWVMVDPSCGWMREMKRDGFDLIFLFGRG